MVLVRFELFERNPPIHRASLITQVVSETGPIHLEARRDVRTSNVNLKWPSRFQGMRSFSLPLSFPRRTSLDPEPGSVVDKSGFSDRARSFSASVGSHDR